MGDFLISQMRRDEASGVRPKGFTQSVLDRACMITAWKDSGEKVAVVMNTKMAELEDLFGEIKEVRLGNVIESVAKAVGIKTCGRCMERKMRRNKMGVRWKKGKPWTVRTFIG
jgi:hypothetical protein